MSDFTFAAGFIGAGNMGGALAQAALSAVPADRIAVICHTPEHTRAAAARLGCPAGDSNAALAATSRFLFLGRQAGHDRRAGGRDFVFRLPRHGAGIHAGRSQSFAAGGAVRRGQTDPAHHAQHALRHRAGCHPVRPQRARDGGGYSRIPYPDGGGRGLLTSCRRS